MNTTEIREVLEKHAKWLRDEEGGERADFSRKDLWGADLEGVNLRGANLEGAHLQGADLQGADLRGTDLRGADLRGADLREAHLDKANFGETNLEEIGLGDLPSGELIGWKKCHDGVIVKLRIPENARRSRATTNKCRAEFAEVLEVIGAETGISWYDERVVYRTGETVHYDKWDDCRWRECAGGIHFFVTREEAEDYS